MMKFSTIDRKTIVHTLKSERFDCVVIGGGITGAGIALDGASRGLKMALVEMQDFGAGTSSRSTKLVHGGLRYLKQYQIKMVAEVGKERAIVYENSPHVTKPAWMLLPIYHWSTFGTIRSSVGLKVYDFLAGVKKSERRKMLSPLEVLTKEPLIKEKGLKGGGYYVEYRTDDARLTIEVMKKAFEKGALTCNYAKVIQLVYENAKVSGVFVEDQLTKEKYKIRAKKVVNAAGPWVDKLREMDQSLNEKTLQLTKGVHLVIDQSRFPIKQAVYFENSDGRFIFAIPRGSKTYVGTTDTFYDQELTSPKITESDRDYLMAAIHFMFPKIMISEMDIESGWAGIRPLIRENGKAASEISRKDEIWVSESNLISIAGGKLTAYRKMAETVVDVLVKQLATEEGLTFSMCQTEHLPLSGGDVGGSAQLSEFVAAQARIGVNMGFTMKEAEHLAAFYGSNVSTVFELVKKQKADAEKYHLPLLLFSKLVYGIECEMVVTPVDFFHRRTSALPFDLKTIFSYKNQVVAYMSEKMQWKEHDTQKYMHELVQVLADSDFWIHN